MQVDHDESPLFSGEYPAHDGNLADGLIKCLQRLDTHDRVDIMGADQVLSHGRDLKWVAVQMEIVEGHHRIPDGKGCGNGTVGKAGMQEVEFTGLDYFIGI